MILYIGVVAITIVIFTMLVNVMDNTGTSIQSKWNIANLMLNSKEIELDGNHKKNEPIGSIFGRIQNVLKNITNKIDSMEITAEKTRQFAAEERKNEHVRRFCHIPKPNTQFPLCDEKVTYVRLNWGHPCYAMENNIRKDDICSILIYLSEVREYVEYI